MNLINTSEYWLQSLHAERDSMNLDKLAENLYRPNIKVPMPIREQKDESSETRWSNDYLWTRYAAIDVAKAQDNFMFACWTRSAPSVPQEEWKTDCYYYCSNPLLHCAVNTSCSDCSDFIPIGGDRLCDG
jgi:hypothetical protein